MKNQNKFKHHNYWFFSPPEIRSSDEFCAFMFFCSLCNYDKLLNAGPEFEFWTFIGTY